MKLPGAIIRPALECQRVSNSGSGKQKRRLRAGAALLQSFAFCVLPAVSRQVVTQLPAAARVAQPAQRLGLDLADALAGDAELLPDLF